MSSVEQMILRAVVRSDTSEYDDDFTKQTDCEVMTVKDGLINGLTSRSGRRRERGRLIISTRPIKKWYGSRLSIILSESRGNYRTVLIDTQIVIITNNLNNYWDFSLNCLVFVV